MEGDSVGVGELRCKSNMEAQGCNVVLSWWRCQQWAFGGWWLGDSGWVGVIWLLLVSDDQLDVGLRCSDGESMEPLKIFGWTRVPVVPVVEFDRFLSFFLSFCFVFFFSWAASLVVAQLG